MQAKQELEEVERLVSMSAPQLLGEAIAEVARSDEKSVWSIGQTHVVRRANAAWVRPLRGERTAPDSNAARDHPPTLRAHGAYATGRRAGEGLMPAKKKGRRKPRGRRARAKARVTDEILFAECIQFAKGLCKDPAWNHWADAWLDATDRGSQAAMDAAEAVLESSEIDPNE